MAELVAPEDLLDAPAAPTTDTLARGTRLGRYELLLPVAKGGMAKVWAARLHGQRGFTKIVAMKTILPHLSSDPAFERMFLDEARIASGVHHPHVAEIYELGEEGTVLYLAMEWVNGDSLVRVLRDSGTTLPIDQRIAARIIADAAAGLHAAHELEADEGHPLGVVHRDMSPHNILLTADGYVKVTDFGVAKAIGQLHDATMTGTLKGKVSYMAPEQATTTQVDRRTDIFSLGVVLYEATTGRLPFRERGENDAQVVARLLEGKFAAPSKVLRGYPPELEAIVLQAMAHEPTKRYATAERMGEALEEWLARSGPIVTQAQVSAQVRQRIAHVIDKRRDRIRQAIAVADDAAAHAHTPSAASQASGVVPTAAASPVSPSDAPTSLIAPALASLPLSAPPPASERGEPAHATTRQYIVASAVGVVVALGLGAAGLFGWRALHPEPAPEPTAEMPSPSTAPSAAPSASATPPPSASAVPPEEELPAAAESAEPAVSAPPLDTEGPAPPKPADTAAPHRRRGPTERIPANPY